MTNGILLPKLANVAALIKDCRYATARGCAQRACMFIVESDVNILMVDTGQKVASNWNPTEHDIMSNDWEIAG